MVLLFFVPIYAMGEGKQFIVVLDAGHGGKDPGALGSSPCNREKDINLKITLEVGRLLKANCPGVKVIYTRETDKFVTLGDRAYIANRAKADLFVSIHTNAVPKESKPVMGVQSYALTLKSAATNLAVEKRENSVLKYENGGKSNSSEMDIMYELIQDRDIREGVIFAQMAQREMVKTGGRRDKGVLQANLAVLRLTYMPSALLEVGYISNPTEEQFLMSTSGQSKMARSIYNAIKQYKDQRNSRTSASKGRSNSSKSAKSSSTAKNNSTAKSNASKSTSTNASDVYRVQVLAGAVKLKPNDRQLKGLKCDIHKRGKLYAYTYGKVGTRAEAVKLKNSIVDKFPGAYIVTY